MTKIPLETFETLRTANQNRSLHLYLTLVANELSNQGQTLQGVVKKVPWAEITPTKASLKEVLWRPVQEIVVGKKSTTELTTKEVQEIYNNISMFLAKEFSISLPWPSVEDTTAYQESFNPHSQL